MLIPRIEAISKFVFPVLTQSIISTSRALNLWCCLPGNGLAKVVPLKPCGSRGDYPAQCSIKGGHQVFHGPQRGVLEPEFLPFHTLPKVMNSGGTRKSTVKTHNLWVAAQNSEKHSIKIGLRLF